MRVAHDVKDSECDFSYALGEKLVKKTDEVSGAEIKNLFSDAFCDQMTVLSRMDPVGTYPTTPVNETCPVDISDMDAAVAPETDADAVAPTIGAIYEDKIMLQEVAVDPSLEEAFLDQLTLDEMIDLICNCGYKTPGVDRLGIPKTNDNDGPASVKGAGGLLYRDSGV